MQPLSTILTVLAQHKGYLRNTYAVSRLGVFGSYARNEQTDQSDVDILVELDHPIGLQFVDLADYLERTLGLKVDLVTRNALKPNLSPMILQELRDV